MVARTHTPCKCQDSASEWANGENWCLVCGGDIMKRLGPIIGDGNIALVARNASMGEIDLFVVWEGIEADPARQYYHKDKTCGISFRTDGCISQIVIYDVASWGETNVRRLLNLLKHHDMVANLQAAERAIEYVIENIDVDLTVDNLRKQ